MFGRKGGYGALPKRSMPLRRNLMLKTRFAALLPTAILIAGCATMDTPPTERIGTATLYSADGLPAGAAQLLANGDTVDVNIALTGISPGVRAVHLHTAGSCAAPDFASAGGRLNPAGRQHGQENPMGSHLGDLPNVTVGTGGIGTGSATLAGTRAEVVPEIFDADGTAVVVHAGADDYRSDPAGAAGNRIACGVFRRS